MKINLGTILKISSIVGPLVKHVQAAIKGPGKGIEKHAAVVEAVKEAIPVVEGTLGDVLDDETFNAALDQLVTAEKALLKAKAEVEAARDRLEALIASIKK